MKFISTISLIYLQKGQLRSCLILNATYLLCYTAEEGQRSVTTPESSVATPLCHLGLHSYCSLRPPNQASRRLFLFFRLYVPTCGPVGSLYQWLYGWLYALHYLSLICFACIDQVHQSLFIALTRRADTRILKTSILIS